MAAAPMLVLLSPPPDGGEQVLRKLQAYFQSGKRSGGGECNVRAGPQPSTFWVHFREERDKKRVESRTDHILQVGTRQLKIIIQPGEGDQSHSQVAAQASDSYSVPARPALPQQEQWAASGHGDMAEDVLTKKIFLTVSATLNTSMFTEEQMKKVTIMYPNLKRERNPDIDVSEKLTGDFTDIEKAYHYFKDILEGNDPNHDFALSETQNGLKDENGLNNEEMNPLTVPTALYEYFSHTHKQEMRKLHEYFGMCLRSKDNGNETTSLYLTSEKSPASLKAARDFFISTFQKSVGDLTQEKIPITTSYKLEETIMKLNEKFSNLLAKEEGNQFLLRGPRNEILAAKEFLEEEGKNSQAEKNIKISVSYKYRDGIIVDASVFKLLETVLRKEFENIEDKFGTRIERKDHSYDRMLILFRPKMPISSDMSSHATESFINAFQSASALLGEKLICLKQFSEDQKKTLNMLLNEKQLEGLHVKIKKKDDKLILIGLPQHFYAAEKHITNLLSAENSTQSENKAPLSSDLSSQEPTGALKKKPSCRQKYNVTSEGQAKARTEEKDNKCPICMERINNKKILGKCKHAFCESCISQAMTFKQVCPVCNVVYGPMKGDQPEGTMKTRKLMYSLPGYNNCGTIEIHYEMKGGIQTSSHPNPGQRYGPTSRIAYLPDNAEGREILELLKRAFNQKLIFTVGQSRTTGVENVITWNDIHHKTNMTGGPSNFGYPDPDYLQRVRSELKAKGIE